MFNVKYGLEALQSIPDKLLKKDRFTEERLVEAAAIVRLNSLRWTPMQAREMARQALVLRIKYPRHLMELLQFIDVTGRKDPHVELFLLELLKEAPPETEWTLLEKIVMTLVNLVELRRTDGFLPDPANRESFRSPRAN